VQAALAAARDAFEDKFTAICVLARGRGACAELDDIAVGFGVSTREQVVDVWRYADAAVVGSAIVAEIEKSNASNAVENVENFLHSLLPQFAKASDEI